MNKEQQMVKEFHEKFGIINQSKPTFLDGKTAHLRISLITEELKELIEANDVRNMVKIADAIGDLLYVVYGTAVSYGIDIEPIFEEIHRSNMSKGDPEKIIREDGKILKGKNYFPPNLEPILRKLGHSELKEKSEINKVNLSNKDEEYNITINLSNLLRFNSLLTEWEEYYANKSFTEWKEYYVNDLFEIMLDTFEKHEKEDYPENNRNE